MASPIIAGAHGAGKSALSRSAILRAAHGHARQAIRQDSFRHARARRWASYRAALSYMLRQAWAVAKCRAAQQVAAAALAAEEEAEAAVLPADVTARVVDLRAFAQTMPFTNFGHERRRAILAEADDIAQAARCIMIPALQDHHHVAH